MEMEYFVPPAEASEWYRYWVDERLAWHVRLGVRESHLRVRPHDADELSHYSTETSDIEYLYPIGWSELEGIANRGDFDLTQHTASSGKNLEWVDAGTGERFVPHVIEPALGVNRSMLTFLIDAYDEEVVAERERTVLRLHPQLAPVKAAVLPLIGKERGHGLEGRARSSRSCAASSASSTTTAARSAAATAARTRSGRRGRSRSTSRRSRTTRSRSATATRFHRSGSRSAARASMSSTGSPRSGARRRRRRRCRATDRRRGSTPVSRHPSRAGGNRRCRGQSLTTAVVTPRAVKTDRSGLALRRRPLEQPLGGSEAEPLVQAVGVGRVENPAPRRERALVDREAHELDASAAAPVVGEHVDVGQVDEPRVGRRPRCG